MRLTKSKSVQVACSKNSSSMSLVQCNPMHFKGQKHIPATQFNQELKFIEEMNEHDETVGSADEEFVFEGKEK